jgi:uncharacterized membrane protein
MLIFFCFLAIFIFLLRFYRKVRNLERKVTYLEKQFAENQQKQYVITPVKEIPQTTLPLEKTVAEEITAIEPEAEALPEPEEVTERAPKSKSRTRTEWELLIGGKWLNWIGAVAIFLGVAFFMKYAFDHNWINEAMRVLIGALFGGLLLFIGGRFANKGLPIFSQGLVGAGIAVLYTAVFASYNFYHLVPQLVSIGLMLLITVLTFQQAIRYQSLSIAVLGWIGAYGTPFLLPSEGSTVGLMSYLSLVTIGMLALVWQKQDWKILYYLSFVATYAIYFGWSLSIQFQEFGVLLPFLILFWLLFYCFDLRYLLQPTNEIYGRIASIINAVCFTGGVIALVHQLAPKSLGTMSSLVVLISLCYLVPILIFYRHGMLSKADSWQLARQGITFLVLVIYATAIYFKISIFLFVASLEAIIIVWWGLRYQVRFVERFGLGFLALVSWGSLLYALTYTNQGMPFVNWNFANLVLSSLGLFLSAHWYGQKGHKKIRQWVHVAWSILLLITLMMEAEFTSDYYFPRDYLPPIRIYPSFINYVTDLAIIVLCLLYAVMLTWFAFRRNVRVLPVVSSTLLSVSLISLMVEGSTYRPLTLFTPVLNVRVVAFLVAIGLVFLFFTLWRKMGEQHKWHHWVRMSSVLAIVILSFELVTVEILDGFAWRIWFVSHGNVIGGNIPQLENTEFTTLVLVWLFSSIPIYLLGLQLRYRLLIQVGLLILGLGSIPAIIKGMSYYSITNFVPVINSRFLSLVCVLVVFAFFIRLIKQQITTSGYVQYLRQALFFLSVFTVFVLVTMEISDAFEGAILSLTNQGDQIIRLVNMQQLTISIAWLLLSCVFLWMGIWQKKQSIRIISICIFGLSICKIFLFDLSFLTTLYRIFSFMGLGIILLAVSFVYQRCKHWFIGE